MGVEEENPEPVKPVFFVAGSRDDLREFPEEVRDAMGFALWEAQNGRKHVHAKPLKGFGGAGVLEIVADHEGSTFRGVYTVKFPGTVYGLHMFQKKSKKGIKTPQHTIDLISKRLKMAEEHYKKWHLSQQKRGDSQ